MSQQTRSDGFWSIPAPQGTHYQKVLERLHRQLNPRRYLEIGSGSGASLRIANCASIAVDPSFARLEAGVVTAKPRLMLFQMPSDRFFAEHDPAALLGGPIDMAFLDGMHLYEFLLRDFINTERHCLKNSVIVLHDCLPCDAYVARRAQDDRSLSAQSPDRFHWWAGDVWKTVAILQRRRPDLAIAAYTAPPTGLVTITNLDPNSAVLADTYAEAVAELRDAGATEFHAYVAALRPDPTSFLDRMENIATRYWI